MRFAYADPPYLGLAQKLYGHLHAEASQYDRPAAHQALIAGLCNDFPDGWALSCQSGALQIILSLCPGGVRVAAWCKSNPVVKKGVSPVYAWEPLILCGGRKPWGYPLDYTRCASGSSPLLLGAKPRLFAFWVFGLLGIRPDDEFHDLFPGSGAMMIAWEEWKSNRSLFAGLREEEAGLKAEHAVEQA